jgi:hypothetical protein
MSSAPPRSLSRVRPLVAVLCSVPLVGEAVLSVLDFAEVRSFSGSLGDVAGLLRWLQPDALIVDREQEAQDAVPFAREHDLPVLHISVRNPALHLFRGGEWEQVSGEEGPTPEAIRNVLAGVLFAQPVPLESTR